MHPTPVRAAALTFLLLAGGAFVPDAGAAQRPAEPRPAPPAPQARAMDAQATREQLIEILRLHPPSVARVLKLDPSLMRNETYLSSYPDVKAFLETHPEIPQNAPYYLEQVPGGYQGQSWDPANQRMRMIEGVLGGLAGFTVFLVVLSALIWIIRTVLDQRRWNRLSKIQADVHTKLMDRFASNEELLTYVQTPSGRRFLESGPVPLQEGPAVVGAPFSRILWSLQAGIVLLVTGLGLLYVSGRTFEETRELFFIIGCLTIALGTGFIASAVASYAISVKLGLLNRTAQDHA